MWRKRLERTVRELERQVYELERDLQWYKELHSKEHICMRRETTVEMTIAEIEKALGHKVKIVEEEK